MNNNHLSMVKMKALGKQVQNFQHRWVFLLCHHLVQYRTKKWNTVSHEIFAGSNFREFHGFSIDSRKFDPAEINSR